MYLADVGFSLKPPKWLRAAAKKVAGTVSAKIETPNGPIIVDQQNAQAVLDQLAKSRLVYGREPGTEPGLFPGVPPEATPWIVGGGVGLVALWLLSHRRRRG